MASGVLERRERIAVKSDGEAHGRRRPRARDSPAGLRYASRPAPCSEEPVPGDAIPVRYGDRAATRADPAETPTGSLWNSSRRTSGENCALWRKVLTAIARHHPVEPSARDTSSITRRAVRMSAPSPLAAVGTDLEQSGARHVHDEIRGQLAPDVKGGARCLSEEDQAMKMSRLSKQVVLRLGKEATAWDRARAVESDRQVSRLLEDAEVFAVARPAREPVSVRLEPRDIFLVRRLARRKGIPPAQLLSLWVHERVVSEARRRAG